MLLALTLLTWMINNNLITAKNKIGTTALNFAAAVGNVEIAKAMLKINGELLNIATRGDNPMKPLFMAASAGLGCSFFIPRLGWLEIFITCVRNDLYGKHKYYNVSYLFLSFLFGLHGLIFSC